MFEIAGGILLAAAIIFGLVLLFRNFTAALALLCVVFVVVAIVSAFV